MCNEARLDELQQQIDQLREAVDEIQAVYLGLEQHAIRATATLRVVVELVQGS
jgi:prefoldin subunit 5